MPEVLPRKWLVMVFAECCGSISIDSWGFESTGLFPYSLLLFVALVNSMMMSPLVLFTSDQGFSSVIIRPSLKSKYLMWSVSLVIRTLFFIALEASYHSKFTRLRSFRIGYRVVGFDAFNMLGFDKEGRNPVFQDGLQGQLVSVHILDCKFLTEHRTD